MNLLSRDWEMTAHPVDFIGHGNEIGAGTLTQLEGPIAPGPIQLPIGVMHPFSTVAAPSVNTSGNTTPTSTTLPVNLSAAQWNAIQSAVQRAFADISKGMTADQIDQNINSYLTSTGLFTADELNVITQGEQNAEPHGGSFFEKGKTPAPFVASWVSNIQNALLGWLQGNAQQQQQQGGGGGAAATDPNIAALVGALTGPIAAPNMPASQPVVYPTSGSAGGGNPLGLAMLLGGIGLGVYWYMRHRHDEKSAAK